MIYKIMPADKYVLSCPPSGGVNAVHKLTMHVKANESEAAFRSLSFLRLC